jgi:hypothetical protein
MNVDPFKIEGYQFHCKLCGAEMELYPRVAYSQSSPMNAFCPVCLDAGTDAPRNRSRYMRGMNSSLTFEWERLGFGRVHMWCPIGRAQIWNKTGPALLEIEMPDELTPELAKYWFQRLKTIALFG